jgi:hypothetical protein
MNPNLRELRRVVRELGGKYVSNRTSGKHFLVIVETPEGKRLRLTLRKGPMREGHIGFWVRQKFARSVRDQNQKTISTRM